MKLYTFYTKLYNLYKVVYKQYYYYFYLIFNYYYYIMDLILMNVKNHLFYKERELSNKKETLGFRIDVNIKKELEKHFKEKYGENGVTIGMNEMVLDYMNNTPLTRTNMPIVISLALPRNEDEIANVTIEDFSNVKEDDDLKDKLFIMRNSVLSGIKNDMFKEPISFNELTKDDVYFWKILEIDDSFDSFYTSKFNHKSNEYTFYQDEFENFIKEDESNFYDLDNVYVVHFLLNNFLDTKSNGVYGNNDKHYGTLSLIIDDTQYFIVIEYKLGDFNKCEYSCYLITQEKFESSLRSRNKELYLNYKKMEFMVNDDVESKLSELSQEIEDLKRVLEDREKLYQELLESSKEKL